MIFKFYLASWKTAVANLATTVFKRFMEYSCGPQRRVYFQSALISGVQLWGSWGFGALLFSTKVPFLQCPLYIKKGVILRLKRHAPKNFWGFRLQPSFFLRKTVSKAVSSLQSSSTLFSWATPLPSKTPSCAPGCICSVLNWDPKVLVAVLTASSTK